MDSKTLCVTAAMRACRRARRRLRTARVRLAAATIGTVGAAALLAGCGSGSRAVPTTTPAVTGPASASAFCQALERFGSQMVSSKTLPLSSPTAAAEISDTRAALRIMRTDAPGAIRTQVDDVVAAWTPILDALAAGASQPGSSPPAGFQAEGDKALSVSLGPAGAAITSWQSAHCGGARPWMSGASAGTATPVTPPTATNTQRSADLYVTTGVVLGRLYAWPRFPARVQYDNHDFIGGLTWKRTDATSVSATGTFYVDTCTPSANCNPSTMSHYAIELTATQPESCTVQVYDPSTGARNPKRAYVYDMLTARILAGRPSFVPTFAPACPSPPTSTSWRVQVSKAGEVFDGIACGSTRACVAVGDVPLATGGGPGATLFTTDGGASWVAGTMPSTDVNLSGAVACPGATLCVADGGGVGGNSGPAGIDASTDGGASWSARTVTSGTAALFGLACPSTAACFATGTDQAGGALILATTDGGTTWTREAIPGGISALRAISCPDTGDCYALGSMPPAIGGPPTPIVLATSDGGASWSVEQVPPAAAAQAHAPLALTDISCPSAGTCFVTGSSDELGAVLTTSDGGMTWAVVGAGTAISRSRPAALSCVSARECSVVAQDAATGAAQVFATSDGGTTWSTSAVTSATTLSAISCPASDACWAVGQAANGAAVVVSDAP